MLTSLKRAVLRAQYGSGVLGYFVNPFYSSRRALAEAFAELGPNLRGRVLDVGCGQKPYQGSVAASEYVGLEFDSPRSRSAGVADFFYDGEHFPFGDESFDGVFSSQVLEHVFNPDQFLSEVRRVVKPGGKLLLSVPFVWDEHEQPVDYGRYTSFGLTHVLRLHGFRVVRLEKTAADFRAICQLVNAYTYKKVCSGRPYLDLLATLVLMAPVTLAGELLGRLLPKNADFYLDNVVLAERVDG